MKQNAKPKKSGVNLASSSSRRKRFVPRKLTSDGAFLYARPNSGINSPRRNAINRQNNDISRASCDDITTTLVDSTSEKPNATVSVSHQTISREAETEMGVIGKLPGRNMCYESIMEEINAKRLKRQSMTAGPFSINGQEIFGEHDERKGAKVPCVEEDFKICAAFTRNEKNLQNMESADGGMTKRSPSGKISITPKKDELEIIAKKEADTGQPTFNSSSECGKKELQNFSEIRNYVQNKVEFTEAQSQKTSDNVSTETSGVDTVSTNSSDFDKSVRLRSLEKCIKSKRHVENQQKYMPKCCVHSTPDIAEENFNFQTAIPEMPEMDPSHSDGDSAAVNVKTASLTDEVTQLLQTAMKGPMEFSCSLCKKLCKNKKALTLHMKNHTEKHACSICGKGFARKDTLKLHQKRHGPKELRCDYCGKMFAEKNTLKIHERIHTGERPYKCKQCSKTFAQHSSWTAHKRTHTGELLYKCDVCEKHLSDRSALKRHKESMHLNIRYTCNICGREFSQKANLMKHELVHTDVKPHKCDHCDKSFRQKAHLDVHLAAVRGDRPFVCNICHKAYPKHSTLETHMRTHTNERPFECLVCGKAFRDRGILHVHLRIHSGEKPFVCQVEGCKKAFAQKGQYNDHQNTHNKKKRFQCEICRMKFSSRSTKYKHKKDCKETDESEAESEPR